MNENLYFPRGGNSFFTKSLKTEIYSTLQTGQYSGHKHCTGLSAEHLLVKVIGFAVRPGAGGG